MDADQDLRDWLSGLVDELTTLEDQLMGVCLHGSLAMGCHYRPKSDADLLVIVEGVLSAVRREDLARLFLAAHDRRPITGGLEVSVLASEHAARYVHPCPYEVHFSETWADAVCQGAVDWTEDRTDAELAANITTARERGISLYGPAPQEVFGEVPFMKYLTGIHCDFDWIVDGENILTTPFYGVLNACRGLMVFRNGLGCVPNKEEAAEWALHEVPSEHRPMIRQALACYRSGAPVAEAERRTHGHSWDRQALIGFVRCVGETAKEARLYGLDESSGA